MVRLQQLIGFLPVAFRRACAPGGLGASELMSVASSRWLLLSSRHSASAYPGWTPRGDAEDRGLAFPTWMGNEVKTWLASAARLPHNEDASLPNSLRRAAEDHSR